METDTESVVRLIGLCAAALLGLAVADVSHLDAAPLGLAATLGGLAAALSWRRPRWRLLALGASAAALGGLRMAVVPAAPSPAQAAPSPAQAGVLQAEVARSSSAAGESPAWAARSPANAALSPVQTAESPALAAPSPAQAGVLQAEVARSSSAAGESPAWAGASPSVAGQSPEEHPPDPLEPYLNTSIRVGGTVVGTPTRTTTGLVRFTLKATHAQQAPRPGGPDPPPLQALADGPTSVLVLCDLESGLADLGEGDAVVFEGRLVPNATRGPPTLLYPGVLATGPAAAGAIADARVAADSADASREGASQATLARLDRESASLRRGAVSGIQRYLPEPQSSLAAGVLLGGSGRLDATFKSDLQRSGLAHLVAIDGFKQVVLAAAVAGPLAWVVGARLAVLTSVAAVASYTVLTGAHPSAVRAGLMVALASLATLTGRVADPLTSLLLAVLAMAMIRPPILQDLGLQLSLSATLGIVLFWPRLRRWLRRLPRPLAEPIGLTLAVTVATLPVTLSAFQVVSLVSPIAHVLAVPLLAPVLFGAALLALVAPIGPLAFLAAWLAWLPTTLLVGVIRIFGELPAAAVATGRLPGLAALGLFAVLLAWGVWGLPEFTPARVGWRRWRNSHQPLLMPIASVGGCLGAAAVLSLLRPDGQLHVEPLAVGRGQALFIRGPTGHTALVVSGRANPVLLSSQVAEHLAVWEHKLDVVVAFDADGDRSAAPTLARYPADRQIRPQSGPIQVDVGGGQQLRVSESAGQLVVSSTSAPTTSAARPGSPD